MTIIPQPYRGESDLVRMSELVFAHPDQNLHVVDLDYRLASWAVTDPQNVALWENERGELVGWAVCQRPFSALDYALRPDFPDVEDAILLWGQTRWQTIARENGERTYYYVGVKSGQHDRITRLQQHGFQADDWSLSHKVRSAGGPMPSLPLPDGFTLRTLVGESECAAYATLHQTAFGTKNMTEDWRRRTLQQRTYRPELDLVAVAPDNQLAAFCIGWVALVQDQFMGQIEPIGVHPDYQGHGIGHALLAENLKRMEVHGAKTMLIEAESANPVSQHLYDAMGFRTAYEAVAYFRWAQNNGVV